ncbi:MAG: hypothetical protein K9H62_18060 [Bacteroidales bacterium]|nr:hypothetical protein [Bacteroidales bacterium]
MFASYFRFGLKADFLVPPIPGINAGAIDPILSRTPSPGLKTRAIDGFLAGSVLFQ